MMRMREGKKKEVKGGIEPQPPVLQAVVQTTGPRARL